MESALFCRFNKKSKANETKEPKAATVTEELKPKVIILLGFGEIKISDNTGILYFQFLKIG